MNSSGDPEEPVFGIMFDKFPATPKSDRKYFIMVSTLRYMYMSTKLTTSSLVDVWCLRHLGASTIGSQLLHVDEGCSHDWESLAPQPRVPIDLFADKAAILISIVSKDIMGCSGGKLKCICPLGIP